MVAGINDFSKPLMPSQRKVSSAFHQSQRPSPYIVGEGSNLWIHGAPSKYDPQIL